MKLQLRVEFRCFRGPRWCCPDPLSDSHGQGLCGSAAVLWCFQKTKQEVLGWWVGKEKLSGRSERARDPEALWRHPVLLSCGTAGKPRATAASVRGIRRRDGASSPAQLRHGTGKHHRRGAASSHLETPGPCRKAPPSSSFRSASPRRRGGARQSFDDKL